MLIAKHLTETAAPNLRANNLEPNSTLALSPILQRTITQTGNDPETIPKRTAFLDKNAEVGPTNRTDWAYSYTSEQLSESASTAQG